ncbi:MAG: AEC family transporter [Synergistaceae bacterium]|nr:AEC family transporter [Synergistaceae bacterium]
MASFIAAVHVVLPMALLMCLGAAIRAKNIIDRPAAKSYDKVIFTIFMPTLLFKNIYQLKLNFGEYIKPIIFIAGGMVILFLLAVFLIPKIIKDPKKAAVIGQAMVRPNFLLYGIAVGEALYGKGNVGTVAVLGAFIVPAINILAAVILEIPRAGKANIAKLFKAVLKNPMIIGAILGFACMLLPFRITGILWDVIKEVAGVTTTVSFISLGIGLDLNSAKSNSFPLIFAVMLRMLIIPLIVLPVAVLSGFRGQILAVIMVCFAGPAAVASYPMAVAMDADGPLAAQIVCTTTIISILTIFIFTFIFKSLGLF